MHRCRVSPKDLDARSCCLCGDTAHYLLRVLRLQSGDAIELFDGVGRHATARIANTERHALSLMRETPPAASRAPHCAITLIVGIIKAARMDWLIEKSSEIGVFSIQTVTAQRCVVHPEHNRQGHHTARRQRIAEAAARQCGSDFVPTIHDPVSLDAALSDAPHPLFVAQLNPPGIPLGKALASSPSRPSQTTLIIGPEGDFTPDELEKCLTTGAIPVSLGPNVLRAETAAIFGLALLNAAWNHDGNGNVR